MTKFLRIISVIARTTYKEIIRDRLLYGIFLIAMLVTASSFFMATISMGQDARVLENVGLAAIHLFTFFICVFVATNSLSRDRERRVLYLLFPKPISRTQYVLGKYLGFLFLLSTTLLLLGLLLGIGSAFSHPEIIRSIVINLLFSWFEIALLLAAALLFASFTAPLNAALYTLALFIIGHSLTTLREFASRNSGALVQHLIAVCYYLLPNLEKFDVRRALLFNLQVPATTVGWSLLYFLVYTAFLLFLAIRIIQREEV